jgi:RNA polymerase sigma factor (sigma-70 family)
LLYRAPPGTPPLRRHQEPAAMPHAFDTPLCLARAAAVPCRRPYVEFDDLAAEAALALVECRARWVSGRGAELQTFAWQRMQGRARDAVRKEARALRNRRSGEPEGDADAPVTISARLDLERSLAAVLPGLDTAERLVLRDVYRRGSSLADLARESRYGADTLQRAHQRLITRLRERMGVEVVAA